MISRKSVKEKQCILLGVAERLISLSFPDLKERGTLLHLTQKVHICPLSSRWHFCGLSRPPWFPCYCCPWQLTPSFQKQDWEEEEYVCLLGPNPSLGNSEVNGLLCCFCCCLVSSLFDFYTCVCLCTAPEKFAKMLLKITAVKNRPRDIENKLWLPKGKGAGEG